MPEERLKRLIGAALGAKSVLRYWDEITQRENVSRELIAQEQAQHIAVLREIAAAYDAIREN